MAGPHLPVCKTKTNPMSCWQGDPCDELDDEWDGALDGGGMRLAGGKASSIMDVDPIRIVQDAFSMADEI